MLGMGKTRHRSKKWVIFLLRIGKMRVWRLVWSLGAIVILGAIVVLMSFDRGNRCVDLKSFLVH